MSISTKVNGPAFTVALPTLQDALKVLDVVPATRPVLPVLGGMVVEADGNTVRLSAVGYEVSATVEVRDAAVTEPGRILIDRCALARILKGATKGENRKTVDGWKVTVTGRSASGTREVSDPHKPGGKRIEDWSTQSAEVTVGDFEVPVECLPLDDYPSLPAPGEVDFVIDRDQLAEAFARVAVAAGRDDTQPMLTGLLLQVADSRMTMAATDRFRLAAATVPVAGATGKLDGLLPATALGRALKVLPAGEIQFGLGETYATLRVDGITITARLLDAEFPRWRKLMPAGAPCTVTVNRAALAKVAAKADALGSGKIHPLRLTVEAGRLVVTPTVEYEHQDRAKGAPVPATVDGELPAAAIGVEGRYLLDALGALDADTAVIAIRPGVGKPLLLANSVDQLFGGASPYRHLVMPAKLADASGA